MIVIHVPVSYEHTVPAVRGINTEWMADLMDDGFVWESLSSDNNSDASLLEELERSYRLDNEGAVDTHARSTNSDDEGPRQRRLRKHRESMSRLRQDRRNRIKLLEKNEESLQHKLDKALAWMGRHRTDHERRGCQRLTYSDLVQVSETLMLQKYGLEEDLLQQQRFAKLLAAEIPRMQYEESGVTPTQPRASPTSLHSVDGAWVRFLDDETPFYYANETPDTCAAAIDEALAAIASTRRLVLRADSPVCNAHCLGWRTESLATKEDVGANRPVLHFRFTRRVARLQASLQELLDKTWALLQSPNEVARLYGSSVVTKRVQNISDDAFIQLRNLSVRENHRLLRCFSLVSRLQPVDGDSAAIVTAALNKQPRQVELERDHCGATVNDAVDWLRHGTATLQFSGLDEDTIEVEYVGSVECVDRDHAAHLTIECCASLVRWEHLVVQPRLLRGADK